MNVNATTISMATAMGFAIVWLICSLLVWLFPAAMMAMSGHMVHTDLVEVSWHLSFGGFLIGLLAWSLSAGFTAWLVASIYNKIS